MGTESIAIIIFIAAGIVATLLVGRLIALLLKIAIVVALSYWIFTKIDFSHLPLW